MEAYEQATFPPLPRDRYTDAGHPLGDMPPHRGIPARQPNPHLPPGVLPLSSLAGYLPPLWLSPHLAMRRAG